MQSQIQAGGGDNKDESEEMQWGGQKQILTPQIDALLDQIDTVLSTDSQTFVNGFVQKGGQ